jgi:NAD(P)-dependent dehydrogenase (short-subunit alcohol dehydrogenase family)
VQVIHDCVAVVTGGGSGIGRGLGLALARRGARVVLADLSGERLERAVDEIRAATGAEVVGVLTDVTDQPSVDRLAERALDVFGAVHVVCNNAGTATVGYSWEAPISDWAAVLNVNLMGVVHGIRSFVPRMLETKVAGHVVNTSSMAGLIPVPLNAAYTASKHAVVGLSRTLEAELVSVGAPIGVTVVCPGSVATAIVDDEIARYESAGGLSAPQRKILEQLKAGIDVGMKADDAGEMVVNAVENDRFWAFPNAEEFFGPAESEWSRVQDCRKPL